ncbi:MAG TPA: antibiotic biosynthesis monooxygenase [Candidatus Lustribacter sp.]|nr:antibiotic biosynthesis monooxygenase [Candidatus Lustribacter sp.]
MNNGPGSNLIFCALVLPESGDAFKEWTTRWQAAVLATPGALSFEFWPPGPDQAESVGITRFEGTDALRTWRRSDAHTQLVAEVKPLIEGELLMELSGQAAAEYYLQQSATEVVVTDIKPGKEAAYREWADRIQKAQAAFPGYLGSFSQPPHQNEKGWTAVLRFNSPASLEAWLNSEQRAALIKEGADLIRGFHAQRVDTSFPGWAPVNPATGKPPNMWKTASLVLLTLFPVVMLEIKFLSPITRALNPSLGTFIGNAISVALTTWPLMPLAIAAFKGWIFPEDSPRWLVIAFPVIVAACYALEIFILWRLLL